MNITVSELKKAAMAFQLKDGTILWIDKEDVNQIANQIIVEGIINKGSSINLYMQSDTDLKKARELHEILTKEKGMTAGLRIQYYEQILKLYKNSGVNLENEPVGQSDPE